MSSNPSPSEEMRKSLFSYYSYLCESQKEKSASPPQFEKVINVQNGIGKVTSDEMTDEEFEVYLRSLSLESEREKSDAEKREEYLRSQRDITQVD